MKTRIPSSSLLGLLLLVAAATPAAAGPIEDAIAQIQNGRVRLSYPTREGVHGGGSHHGVHIGLHRDMDHGRGWASDCEEGPARVQLRVRNGELRDIDIAIGGRWVSTTDDELDLGLLDAEVASAYFLRLAETGRGEAAEDAVLAVVIADTPAPWERILALARDRSRPQDLREQAIFWLGVAAGDKVTEGISSIARDHSEEMELREHAVFALSQIEGPAALEKLMEIARSHDEPEIRQKALFWLAQRDEEQVLALFEEILLGG